MATSPTLHRWLTRLRNYAIMDDTMDDDETPIPPSTPDTRGSGNPFFPFGRSASLRIETVQPTRLMIRRAIRTFEEASDAVEALRDGQAQIINLDNIPIEMANRIVDFIAGATYALDGTVEKIGEQVYLFTPPSFQIEHDDHLVQFQKRVLNRPKID